MKFAAMDGRVQCDRLSNLRTEVKQTRLRAAPCGTLGLTLNESGKCGRDGGARLGSSAHAADVRHRPPDIAATIQAINWELEGATN